MTKSLGVIRAMSSIFSTVTNGVGTQTASLPARPGTGSNGFLVASCASIPPAETHNTDSANNRRTNDTGSR